jgi:hypothetical protein
MEERKHEGKAKKEINVIKFGIAQSVYRLAMGVLIPAGARDFSLLHSVQTGSGADPTSYPMSTGGSFPGGNAAGA